MTTKPPPTPDVDAMLALISGPADMGRTFPIPEPPRWWSQAPLDVKTDAARHIAFWLLKAAEGPLDKPATWRAVAVRRNIQCKDACRPGEGRGCFIPPSRDAGEHIGGTIFVNHAFDEADQVRGWVHELAHYILYFWQCGGILNHCADLIPYEGDTEETHHEIADIAEDFVCGPGKHSKIF